MSRVQNIIINNKLYKFTAVIIISLNEDTESIERGPNESKQKGRN